jgi:DNA polymerase family A
LSAADIGEFVLVDGEFYPEDGVEGGRPVPVCIVVKEFRSGRTWRLWRDELRSLKGPPFDTGPYTAIVAFFASAEGTLFKALGWAMPENVIDLYAEYRCRYNGGPKSACRSLLDIMLDSNQPFMSEQRKEEMRATILTGEPNIHEQCKEEIQDYCSEDVDALRILLRHSGDRIDVPRALLRGRYMIATAEVEWISLPIDVGWWRRFLDRRPAIRSGLIRKWDAKYQVYGKDEAWSFKRFGKMLRRFGIENWPRSEPGGGKPGHYLIKDEVFKEQCRVHPELEGLRQLRKVLRMIQEPKLRVGPDGRNRVSVGGFGTESGRNAPKAGIFICGQARCMRGMIRPTEGMALAYIDWAAQEIAVAASLSRDENMKASYLSGDPYLHFAIAVGLAPPHATKATHGEIREICKTLMLGINYGMTVFGLAARLEISGREAESLMLLHRNHYRTYWRWLQSIVEKADLRGFIKTMFGWRLQVTDKTTERTLMNFPMQATGAEMMRIACIAMVEKRIRVCAILHDAFFIEAPLPVIGAVTALAEGIMQETGYRLIGLPVRTEARVIAHPDGYMDGIDRGKNDKEAKAARMWDDINELMRGDDG